MKSQQVSGSLVFLVFLLFLALTSLPHVLEAGAWMLSTTRWTDKDEKAYQSFVGALGKSKYGRLNQFLKDPKANPLYGEEDKNFRLSPDCADLPYQLRAYVAYKLRLPFGYVSAISGKGGDQRYSRDNKPTDTKDFDNFSSPQSLFSKITLVNSGYYRMAPEIENSDTYPVKIDPNSIVPGTIYYDPNGHVAVVYEVTPEGRIRMIDAHPDKTISRPWFGAKFVRGNASKGGGFRRWRPIWYSGSGQIVRLGNVNIPDFSASDQYQNRFSAFNRNDLSYYDYVKVKLSTKKGKINPVEDFRQIMQEIHEDLKYRVEAVEICLKAGINKKEHPGHLPWNIYGTDGEWETYSTPSRDARLKVAFREFFLQTQNLIRLSEVQDPNLVFSGTPNDLAKELLRIYDVFSPVLGVKYENSQGKKIALSFDEVVKRLFKLSFDPYHSIEYRWGASDEELEASRDSQSKKKFYQSEQRLRNQLERVYNQKTGLNSGPATPVDVDIRFWLISYIKGTGHLVHQISNKGSNSPCVETRFIASPHETRQFINQNLVYLERTDNPTTMVSRALEKQTGNENSTKIVSFTIAGLGSSISRAVLKRTPLILSPEKVSENEVAGTVSPSSGERVTYLSFLKGCVRGLDNLALYTRDWHQNAFNKN